MDDGRGRAGGAAIAAPVSAQAERLRRILELVKSRTSTQRDADKRLFLRHGRVSPLNAGRISGFWVAMSPGLFEGIAAGVIGRPPRKPRQSRAR